MEASLEPAFSVWVFLGRAVERKQVNQSQLLKTLHKCINRHSHPGNVGHAGEGVCLQR